ncbi:MAG: TIR domain-containing protein [Rhodobacteraceae bacterium]|nr:TIR domain-containing protein [Paracoccaceae bacterium]
MKTHNLFISHSWNYSDSFDKLIALLDSRSWFSYNNYSVPRDDPIHNAGTTTRLREAIRAQMQPCGAILILAGVYATYSKWINEEIHLAQTGFHQQKPIIAIEPWGSERTSVPVKRAASIIVKWNSDSIVSAIRELAH